MRGLGTGRTTVADSALAVCAHAIFSAMRPRTLKFGGNITGDTNGLAKERHAPLVAALHSVNGVRVEEVLHAVERVLKLGVTTSNPWKIWVGGRTNVNQRHLVRVSGRNPNNSRTTEQCVGHEVAPVVGGELRQRAARHKQICSAENAARDNSMPHDEEDKAENEGFWTRSGTCHAVSKPPLMF